MCGTFSTGYIYYISHNSSLTSSTQATYTFALNGLYHQFCRQTQVSIFSINRNRVKRFYVTSLARRLAYRTIKVYLAGLQYHSMEGPLVSDMPLLHYLPMWYTSHTRLFILQTPTPTTYHYFIISCHYLLSGPLILPSTRSFYASQCCYSCLLWFASL